MGYLGTLGRGIMSPLPLYYSQKGWGLGTNHFLCKTVIKFPHSSSLFPQSVKDGCDGLTLVILYSVQKKWHSEQQLPAGFKDYKLMPIIFVILKHFTCVFNYVNYVLLNIEISIFWHDIQIMKQIRLSLCFQYLKWIA